MKACIKQFNDATEYFFDEGCFIVETSNSADDAEVSIARARVEAGKTTQWHRLKGISERYVILTGHGRVEIENLAPQEVVAGDVALIPPMVRQRIRNIGTTDLIFLAICSPPFTRAAYLPA